jgi:transposase
MKRTTKYVFLDVHQATTFAAVREETGRIIARTVLPTEAHALVEFVVGMRGSRHVAFEEGTQAQWLHELLSPLVDQVLVCHRRGEKRAGNKADKLDAEQGSELLRQGSLRAVYHGGRKGAELKEYARTYDNMVEDGTRVMLRVKALFRARGIKAAGKGVYHPRARSEWLGRLEDPAVRFRAELLYGELDVLREVRPQAKQALVSEAKKHAAYGLLRTIPFFGPVRVAQLLAVMQTPWRFRTKRHFWAYAGLAVVTHSTSDYELEGGRIRRKKRGALTRGLNPNHNRVLKSVFKGAAQAAIGRPGPLQELYRGMLERGMRPELARVTLARKLAAVVLHVWKTGERYDPSKLTKQVR